MRYDVVVVGAGPNGLAAAAVAARCGLSTVLFEANDSVGGGARSSELTLSGFVHDTCSAVHPLARASRLFRELPLGEHGLTWITPPSAAAHPLDSGEAALLANDLHETSQRLGRDRARYEATIGAIAHGWHEIEWDVLRPLGIPSRPLAFARFGLQALFPASAFARLAYTTAEARSLFAGCAGHSLLPFSRMGSSAISLVLSAAAHVYGWPIPRGGSRAISSALCAHFLSLGGEVVTGCTIRSHAQLPAAKVMLFDTSPGAMARILGDSLPDGYARSLRRYRYGPGVFKVDWALSEPIPWRARECSSAATVHVGGTIGEIASAERAPWAGLCADRPFVLLTQPSLFDDTRAPPGLHTAWGYCHVPNGSNFDMTSRIEAQVERFAPGFRDTILGRSVRTPLDLERDNENLVGGDLGGGSNELANIFLRPTWRTYSTPLRGAYLCSASTPPGAGVHGLCGYHAAARAITREFGASVFRASGLALESAAGVEDDASRPPAEPAALPARHRE